MKIYKINEIFSSIQGEGFNTGKAVIFIRFSGCNLKCSFCDTDHFSYSEMTIDDIMNDLKKYAPISTVILTGGEPTLQLDRELLYTMYTKYDIYLETNGTNSVKEYYDLLSWITVSPKTKEEGLKLFNTSHANELKLVYTGQDLEKYEEQYISMQVGHLYLQPCDDNGKTNIKEVIEICKKNPIWKVSVQIQKLLKIR